MSIKNKIAVKIAIAANNLAAIISSRNEEAARALAVIEMENINSFFDEEYIRWGREEQEPSRRDRREPREPRREAAGYGDYSSGSYVEITPVSRPE